MKSVLQTITMFMATILTCGTWAQTVTSIEFDTVNWVLPENYQLTEFDGKQVLLVENSSDGSNDPYAYIKDYDFSDGIIEFDMYCPQNYPAYVGFLFRLNKHNDEDRYELFYFRPFMSNSLGAVQYIPVNNGVAHFQYYTDNVYQSSGRVSHGKWLHVKAIIEGPKAEVYVDDINVMTVNNLGRGLSEGSVGVWMDSTTPKCYYANFTVTK